MDDSGKTTHMFWVAGKYVSGDGSYVQFSGHISYILYCDLHAGWLHAYSACLEAITVSGLIKKVELEW